MINGKETFNVSTRASMKEAAKVTTVTVVFDGASDETLKHLAMQQLIVRVQQGWRNKGIPATATINVKDYAPGVRMSSSLTPEQALAQAMDEAQKDPAKRAALIAKLQALGIK